LLELLLIEGRAFGSNSPTFAELYNHVLFGCNRQDGACTFRNLCKLQTASRRTARVAAKCASKQAVVEHFFRILDQTIQRMRKKRIQRK